MQIKVSINFIIDKSNYNNYEEIVETFMKDLDVAGILESDICIYEE